MQRTGLVCPSRVEVSFSSVLEVPSRTEVVYARALLRRGAPLHGAALPGRLRWNDPDQVRRV